MDICQTLKHVAEEVTEFTIQVSAVGEESITDYLFWRWMLANLSQSFFQLQFESFTKNQESKVSGADFELEIWLIGAEYSLPLVIQAKKISSEHKAYRSAFRYPKDTKHQIDTLLNYARTRKKVPLYIFYSQPISYDKKPIGYDNQTSRHIYRKSSDGGIYIAYAMDIMKFANRKPRAKVSKTEILNKCINFHDLFCPLNQASSSNKSNIQIIVEAFKASLGDKSGMRGELIEQIDRSKTEQLPEYVKLIMRQKLDIREFDNELNQIIENMLDRKPRKVMVINVK